MKIPNLIVIAMALSLAVVRAEGPAEKAGEIAQDTVDTAKNVGHSVARGTKKAARKVKETLTPDPDANRVEVKVGSNMIDLPKTVPAGKTAFVVTNTASEKLTFEVERAGEEPNYTMTLGPTETKVLHVHLQRGKYHAGCVINGRETERKEVDLRVR